MVAGGQQKVMVLEADRVRRDNLRALLDEEGYLTYSFENVKICLDNLKTIDPDLVVASSVHKKWGCRFLYALKWTRPNLPLLIISDDQSITRFVQDIGFTDIGLLRGNFDFYAFQQEIDRLEKNGNPVFQPKELKFPMIVGESQAIVKIRKMVRACCGSDETVFIVGDFGTGKELVANAIHFGSERSNGPYVRVCGEAISLENPGGAVFGRSIAHGSRGNRGNGAFPKPGGGTLFIDEVGLLPPTIQAQLLQILDDIEKEGYCLIGQIPAMRVIVSSSMDLSAAVARGEFRKDLFYRLNVLKIDIPPLRQRPDDITSLVDFFTDKFCMSLGRSHYDLAETTMAVFQSYHWPGNVRELERMVKRTVILGEDNTVVDKLCINNGEKDACHLVGYCEDLFASTDEFADTNSKPYS